MSRLPSTDRARRIEERFEWPMIVAALLVIPALVIEGSDFGDPWPLIGDVLNWTIWLAFLFELVVMLRVVPDRRRWLRDHPLEVAVVLLTPPFLPASLEAARVFRLLRVIRLLALASRLRRLISAEGVRDAAVLTVFVVLGGGAAFSAVEKGENLSAWDGVWWAVTTVTTVGYGDIYPKTDAGRIIAMAVMIAGIGFVALLTAAAAERIIRDEARLIEAEREASEAVENDAQLPGHEPRELLADIRLQLDELERAVRRSEA